MPENMERLYDLLHMIYYDESKGDKECTEKENEMYENMNQLINSIEDVYKSEFDTKDNSTNCETMQVF